MLDSYTMQLVFLADPFTLLETTVILNSAFDYLS